MPIRSSVLPYAARPFTFSLADEPQVRAALDWFPKNLAWINEQQSRLTEIPAPSFEEEKRAAAVKELLAAEGLPVSTDKTGNVIGELRGSNEKETVLVAAHLDTVFPAGTDVTVHVASACCAGISDNGTGLAALVAMARALHIAKIAAAHHFVRRQCWRRRRRQSSRHARVDGCLPRRNFKPWWSWTDRAPTTSRRKRWPRAASKRRSLAPVGTAGRTSACLIPSTHWFAVRVRFINTGVPATPRTSFNIGQIEGGTSVNSIRMRPG